MAAGDYVTKARPTLPFGGDAGFGGTPGAVPAPTAGDAAKGKFLGADGTWSAPDDATLEERHRDLLTKFRRLVLFLLEQGFELPDDLVGEAVKAEG